MCIYKCMRLLPETQLTSIKEHQTVTTHNINPHCPAHFYACVGQPLLKQLYTRYLFDAMLLPHLM